MVDYASPRVKLSLQRTFSRLILLLLAYMSVAFLLVNCLSVAIIPVFTLLALEDVMAVAFGSALHWRPTGT